MSYLINHKKKFDDLKAALDSVEKNQLRARANGGNTLLFVYPPKEESLYLDKAKELFINAEFIDLGELLVAYIDETGWEDFQEFYEAYPTSTYQVFKSEGEQNDFFKSIINSIQEAIKNGKVPFLIRTGILYGTGVENVNIMEHKKVMNASLPLVVFYPGKIEDNDLRFLNFKPASKYRCTLID